jgi:hypothetical protein
MMRRWQGDGVPAEARAEIADIYRPALIMLLSAGYSGHHQMRRVRSNWNTGWITAAGVKLPTKFAPAAPPWGDAAC